MKRGKGGKRSKGADGSPEKRQNDNRVRFTTGDSEVRAAGGMAAEKRGDLMAIAAGRHGTPATAVRARVIVEKETARGIRAAANRSSRTFDEKVGGRAGDGSEQPLEPALASNELNRPCALTEDKLIVPLGDAEEFIDRFHPGRRERISVHNASEDGP